MKITFDKWIRRPTSRGPYYIQYFRNENDKAMGWICREVIQPWSDCNNEVTTHYEVTYCLNRDIDQPIEIFPVLSAAVYVTEEGEDYLSTYFPNKTLGESSFFARSAGTKAKRFIKELAKKRLLNPYS